MLKRILLVFLPIAIFLTLHGFAQPAVPTLQQRVTDFTNSLSYTEWRMLETRLQRFEDSTSTQIAILLIKSLEGANIDEYGMSVFERNKIGRKAKDNGVLLLVAKEDSEIRIDVGYGLEGVLTDAATSLIISREISPKFREGKFAEGLIAGADAIMGTVAGEYDAEEKGRIAPLLSVVLALFVIGFLGAFVIPMLSGKRRTVIRSGNWQYHSGWGWRSGGLGGGGFGGGSFGGGSFGGGGWSGGGGMAGGGGASGSW